MNRIVISPCGFSSKRSARTGLDRNLRSMVTTNGGQPDRHAQRFFWRRCQVLEIPERSDVPPARLSPRSPSWPRSGSPEPRGISLLLDEGAVPVGGAEIDADLLDAVTGEREKLR